MNTFVNEEFNSSETIADMCAKYDPFSMRITNGSLNENDYHAFSHCTQLYDLSFDGAVTGDAIDSFGQARSMAILDIGNLQITDSFTCPPYIIAFAANSISSLPANIFSQSVWLLNASFDSLTVVSKNCFQTTPNLQQISIRSVVSIMESAFCTIQLLELDAPMVEYIGSSAFYGCQNLLSVTAPRLTNVSMYAFSGCDLLETVDAPAIRYIESYAFAECISLIAITMETVYEIQFYAFYMCSSLTNATIDHAKVVDYSAFSQSGIRRFRADLLTSITAMCCESCTHLAEVSCSHVEKISRSSFRYCSALRSISFPKLSIVIDYAFELCISLQTADMPLLLAVGTNGFALCVGLTSINLPKATHISTKGFFCCEYLINVTLTADYCSIGSSAFEQCLSLQSISLGTNVSLRHRSFACTNLTSVPDSIVEIGRETFANCFSLDSVCLGKLTSIARSAFVNCVALRNAQFAECTEIRLYAFDYCGDLESVVAPEVTVIEMCAFRFCESLRNINFPKIEYLEKESFQHSGIENADFPILNMIPESTFECCSNLRTVDAPRVYRVGARAFAYCHTLESVMMKSLRVVEEYGFAHSLLSGTSFFILLEDIGKRAFWDTKTKSIPESVQIIGDEGYRNTCIETLELNQVDNIGSGAFQDCQSLRSIVFDSFPGVMGKSVFANCVSLQTVSSGTIQTLPDFCFCNCTLLESAYFISLDHIGNSAFENCKCFSNLVNSNLVSVGNRSFYGTSISSIHGIVSIGVEAFAFSNVLTITALLITTISPRAFYRCPQLSSVNMPLLINVSDECFKYCTNLTMVSIPYVEHIGNAAFGNCTSLAGIVMINVETIGDEGFYACANLPDLSLTHLTYVGVSAFAHCTSICQIAMPKLSSELESSFYGCTSLRMVYLPNVTSLNGAFMNCVSLEDCTLPSLEDVYSVEFANCMSLREIRLPSLRRISPSCFYNCTNLTTVSCPNVVQVSHSAFFSCKSLPTFSAPELLEIGEQAFAHCTALTQVNIGEPFIKHSAFNGCVSLTTVLGRPIQIGNFGFFNCVSLTTINFSLTTYIEDWAFAFCYALKGDLCFPMLSAVLQRAFCNMSITSFYAPQLDILFADTFRDCTKLVSVAAPNVTMLHGNNHFRDCVCLVNVSLPALVTADPEAATIFHNCISLSRLELGDLPPQTFNETVFTSCHESLVLVLPSEASIQHYDNACQFDGEVENDHMWYGIKLPRIASKSESKLWIYILIPCACVFFISAIVVVIFIIRFKNLKRSMTSQNLQQQLALSIITDLV